jgi:glucose/mannose transport system substrate-binding protein
MYKKALMLVSFLMLLSIVLSACAPAATPTPQTIEVTRIVAGTPQIQQVIITATPQPPEQKLEIFHWWTAPGEREAADAMFKAFKDKYPDVKIVENPAPGGGGVNMRVVLQARLTAGLPPDTFQTLGGAELKNYVDSNVLKPLDDLWKQLDYANKIPGPLAKAVTINGHPYVVPLNMHIQNILYYSKKVYDELKLTPPTTFEELLANCDAIKKAHPDMTCLALGSMEKWEDAFVFDSILLQEGGAQHYVDVYKGNVDVTTDAAFKSALTKFQKLYPYINADHSNLTWDQATALLGSGKAAMTLMGTWAIGALVKGSNWQPGVDFGAVTFPQKPERILLFHPDTYGCTVNAPDPDVCLKWLEVVASPELQVPTDVIQGGLFARTDIDPKQFPDPIRQELMQYVRDNPAKLILDQHGSILPATAQPIYWDIMATFLSKPNANINDTLKAVNDMMKTYDVKTASAWYQWP